MTGVRRVGAALSNGFVVVRETPEEVEAYKAGHSGHAPAVYRSACAGCGLRIWHSGFAVGSHRRACQRVARAV